MHGGDGVGVEEAVFLRVALGSSGISLVPDLGESLRLKSPDHRPTINK
jgi:hypothetical protein